MDFRSSRRRSVSGFVAALDPRHGIPIRPAALSPRRCSRSGGGTNPLDQPGAFERGSGVDHRAGEFAPRSKSSWDGQPPQRIQPSIECRLTSENWGELRIGTTKTIFITPAETKALPDS